EDAPVGVDVPTEDVRVDQEGPFAFRFPSGAAQVVAGDDTVAPGQIAGGGGDVLLAGGRVETDVTRGVEHTPGLDAGDGVLFAFRLHEAEDAHVNEQAAGRYAIDGDDIAPAPVVVVAVAAPAKDHWFRWRRP